MVKTKTLEKSQKSYSEKLISKINKFMDFQVEHYRQKGFLLGLSGGIDSATLLKLIVDRYGPKSIACVITYKKGLNNSRDVKDAVWFCRKLGVDYFYIDITKPAKSLVESVPELRSQPMDNIASRIRVGVACELAVKNNLRVLWAGPYTDWVLSGSPIGSDSAHCYPFGGLYKSEIYAIAERIGVPKRFLKKKPSNSGRIDKSRIYLGVPLSKIDKIIGYLNGLLPRKAIQDVSEEQLMYFEFYMKLFEPDIDIRCLNDYVKLSKKDRKNFLKNMQKLPFEG